MKKGTVKGPFIHSFGNAVFTTQAIHYDSDLLLRTVLLARLALDVTNSLF